VLGRRAIYDIPTALIAIVVFLLMARTRRIPEPVLIAAAGVAGLLLR
jgi:chromate transporter